MKRYGKLWELGDGILDILEEGCHKSICMTSHDGLHIGIRPRASKNGYDSYFITDSIVRREVKGVSGAAPVDFKDTTEEREKTLWGITHDGNPKPILRYKSFPIYEVYDSPNWAELYDENILKHEAAKENTNKRAENENGN